jgi:hypothetical protein
VMGSLVPEDSVGELLAYVRRQCVAVVIRS